MISGKEFSNVCKWVVDPRYPERAPFSYSESRNGDWVFVNGDYMDVFLHSLPFLSLHRFFVIIHNTDTTFTTQHMERLRPHVYRVYAINANFTHPRLTLLPIGFMDSQLDFLSSFQPKQCERDIEIYLNFKRQHNPDKRNECIRVFENDPRVVQRNIVSVSEYYDDLCRSKFVLCPEGTGMDTHRVYESILCGAIPVVLRNSLAPLYEKLPVCIVNSWKDPFYIPQNKEFPVNPLYYLGTN